MVIDVMQTSSMPWADVVVPVATMYECDHPFEVSGNWIMARNKVIKNRWATTNRTTNSGSTSVSRWGTERTSGTAVSKQCMNYQLEIFRHDHGRAEGTSYRYCLQAKPMEYEKYEQIFATPSTRISRAPYFLKGKSRSTTLRSRRMGLTRCRYGWSRRRVQRDTPNSWENSPWFF